MIMFILFILFIWNFESFRPRLPEEVLGMNDTNDGKNKQKYNKSKFKKTKAAIFHTKQKEAEVEFPTLI